jgi:hypothetical protein
VRDSAVPTEFANGHSLTQPVCTPAVLNSTLLARVGHIARRTKLHFADFSVFKTAAGNAGWRTALEAAGDHHKTTDHPNYPSRVTCTEKRRFKTQPTSQQAPLCRVAYGDPPQIQSGRVAKLLRFEVLRCAAIRTFSDFLLVVLIRRIDPAPRHAQDASFEAYLGSTEASNSNSLARRSISPTQAKPSCQVWSDCATVAL